MFRLYPDGRLSISYILRKWRQRGQQSANAKAFEAVGTATSYVIVNRSPVETELGDLRIFADSQSASAACEGEDIDDALLNGYDERGRRLALTRDEGHRPSGWRQTGSTFDGLHDLLRQYIERSDGPSPGLANLSTQDLAQRIYMKNAAALTGPALVEYALPHDEWRLPTGVVSWLILAIITLFGWYLGG